MIQHWFGYTATGGAITSRWVPAIFGTLVFVYGGLNPGLNRVIGVTSYGSLSLDPKTAGASIPDSRFVQMLAQCALDAWATADRWGARRARYARPRPQPDPERAAYDGN